MIDKLSFGGHYEVNLAGNSMRNMRAIKEAEFLTLEDKIQSGYQTNADYSAFPNGGVVDITLNDKYNNILEAFFAQRGIKFTKYDNNNFLL